MRGWAVKCAHYLWSWPRWNSKWPSWRSSTNCGHCTWLCPPRMLRAAAPRTRQVSDGPSASTGPRPSVCCPSTARPRSHALLASRRTYRTTRTRLRCNEISNLLRRTWSPVSPVMHWSRGFVRYRANGCLEGGLYGSRTQTLHDPFPNDPTCWPLRY